MINSKATAKPLAMIQPLCQAIREGRKTVTRRMIRNPQYYGCPTGDCPHEKQSECDQAMNSLSRKEIGFAVGEIRYLTETHWAFGHWDHVQKKGRMGWQFVCDRPDDIRFEAPNCALASMDKADPGIPTWYKRNGRFMPRAYARTFIRVKDVRVERVQDIAEADATREGVADFPCGGPYRGQNATYWTADIGGEISGVTPLDAFRNLWDSLHQCLGDWLGNPWVSVVQFERIEI